MIVSLKSYRARKAAARAYHPCVWEPKDSIDTAQEFAAELAHAERGIAVEPERTARIFSMGRYRKAKLMDGLAVGLLVVLMAAFGTIVYTASAKAEPSSSAETFAAVYAPAVCDWLDTHPTLTGLESMLLAVADLGYTPQDAGAAIAESVFGTCPQYTPLLRAFVAKWGGDTV